jgi:hypothetical protein
MLGQSERMKVLFCLQMCPIDCMAGLELAQIIAAMPIHDNSFEWLVSYRQDTPLDRVMRTQIALSRKFPKVTSYRAYRFAQGWPAGPNALWFSTMEYAADLHKRGLTKCEGILTFEADCVPTRRDWMEVLDAAYENRKAPIVGNLHRSEIPDHINGNSVFPIDLLTTYPDLVKCPMIHAWDFFHRELFLSIAEDSPYLTQYYQRRNLTKDEFIALRKHGERPALLHGVKDSTARSLARFFLTGKKSLEPWSEAVLNNPHGMSACLVPGTGLHTEARPSSGR